MSNCPMLKDRLEEEQQEELDGPQSPLPVLNQRFIGNNLELEFPRLPPPALLNIDVPLPNNSPNVREVARVLVATTRDRIFILD